MVIEDIFSTSWTVTRIKELGSLTTKFGPISEIDEKHNIDNN